MAFRPSTYNKGVVRHNGYRKSVSAVTQRRPNKNWKPGAKTYDMVKLGLRATNFMRKANAARRRKARLNRRIAPRAAGSTLSYFKAYQHARGPVKDILRDNAMDFYQIMNPQRISTNTFGAQSANGFSIGNSTDLTSISNKCFGTHTHPHRYALARMEHTMMITNQDLTNCFVDIYEIYNRRDANAGGPVTSWAAGATAEGGAVNTIGSTPFQSNQFCVSFHVDKIYRIELEPGRSHKHFSTYNVNRMVRDEQIVNFGEALGGITRYLLLVASGSPINDATNNSLVSTSKVALDVVTILKYTFSYSVDAGSTIYMLNNLNTVTTGNVMDDGSGSVKVEVAA